MESQKIKSSTLWIDDGVHFNSYFLKGKRLPSSIKKAKEFSLDLLEEIKAHYKIRKTEDYTSAGASYVCVAFSDYGYIEKKSGQKRERHYVAKGPIVLVTKCSKKYIDKLSTDMTMLHLDDAW